jgi:phage gp29-like protein
VLDHGSRPLISILRKLGSLLPTHQREPAAQPVAAPIASDFQRTYPSAGLTPGGLRAVLQAADAGQPHSQFELFHDMLRRWPRLRAVETTRRLALTGLDWEVAPPPDTTDGATIADHCRATLDRVRGLRETLDHLGTAIGFGLAVAELVWQDGQLVELIPVPHARLCADPHEPWRLRVKTATDDTLGVALDEQPHKWIVHRPRHNPASNFDNGLLRASALLFLVQSLSLRDWLVFSQVAGMPVRVAQFEPGTPAEDKRKLVRMLEALGTEAVAAFSKNVDLRFLDAARNSDRPYQPLQEYCNTEVTILWLGQHLTTDIKSSGSRAAAEVHDRVREDLLVDDIADEAATLRRDLLTPLVRARFGEGAAVPQFRRSLVQSVDTKVLADTLAVAVNQLGLRVPAAWVHQALGVPQPDATEPALSAGGAA